MLKPDDYYLFRFLPKSPGFIVLAPQDDRGRMNVSQLTPVPVLSIGRPEDYLPCYLTSEKYWLAKTDDEDED